MDGVRGLDQVRLNGLVEWGHLGGDLRRCRHHRAIGNGVRIEVGDDFASALNRNVMVLVEVDQLGLQPRPILDRLAHVGRKSAGIHGAAGWAPLDLGAMLSDSDLYWRQIEHLTPLSTRTGDVCEDRLAVRTDGTP